MCVCVCVACSLSLNLPSQSNYGPTCNISCIPRNDTLGHYTCNTNGTKVCLNKYKGANCELPCPVGFKCLGGVVTRCGFEDEQVIWVEGFFVVPHRGLLDGSVIAHCGCLAGAQAYIEVNVAPAFQGIARISWKWMQRGKQTQAQDDKNLTKESL